MVGHCQADEIFESLVPPEVGSILVHTIKHHREDRAWFVRG